MEVVRIFELTHGVRILLQYDTIFAGIALLIWALWQRRVIDPKDEMERRAVVGLAVAGIIVPSLVVTLLGGWGRAVWRRGSVDEFQRLDCVYES